jgi:periplasmic divalent cation tolerance protein
MTTAFAATSVIPARRGKMPLMPDFLQITTAAPTREEAERIAAVLVEHQLAACVQIIGPVQSIYRWQEVVERAAEWLCLIKTTSDQFVAIERAIRELHSYECPEIIATPIVAGSEVYLGWLGEQTRQD